MFLKLNMINCGLFNISGYNLTDYVVKINYPYIKFTIFYFDHSKKFNNPIHTIDYEKH